MSIRIKAYLTVGFFFLFSTCFAQNQKEADSLKSIFISNEFASDDEYILLEGIAALETNPEEGILYANKLISLAQIDSAYLWMYRGYIQKGSALRTLGNLEESISAYFKSAEAAEKVDYKAGVGGALLSIGAIYANNDDHTKAIKYRNEAIEILRDTPDSVTLAVALLNTGYGYYLIDKYDSALSLYEESAIIFEIKENLTGKAYNLGNAGLVYAKQGKTQEAEEQLTEAIEILKELEDSYAITEFEIEMANIYEQRGEKQKAEKYLLGALAYAQEDGLKERIRDASLQLSELYSGEQEFEKAYAHLQNYLVYRDSINNEETIRRIADLRTEFEVGQKQAEVDLLEQEAYIQRVFMWAGLVVGLLFLGLIVLLHRLYLIKVRNVRIAKERRRVIQGQRDQLDHLNATKDRFFSIISHDLRGPVSNFNGVAYLIQRNIEEENLEELRRMGLMLEESAQDLSSLLDNLLDWAMNQQGTFPYNPLQVKVDEICNPSLRVMRNAALAKQIELTESIHSDIEVLVDVNSTSTIIRNLLNNALKFTPDGGQVKLAVSTEESYALIQVSDTGVGIPEDKLKGLFEFKGERTTWGTQGEKGVGLGLNLVKDFVELNKGKVEVTSEVGVGTTFKIYLPMAQG